ncbi:Fe-S-containing protein [Entomohabitans teleogrylli]|uniref:Fe-S-containing protein n=1 Tax=Entomohabitans teleogrylli TaxID=1384589 RepID=UPI00073D236A|nr:Fe-S-containing protein [Entomohabitans teleogrylli]
MSYFFVTTLQAFLCIALLSGLLWSRTEPPALRPLVWTLLSALALGLCAGLLMSLSQPAQLALAGAEVVIVLLFLLSFRRVPHQARYLWQGILVLGAARHWALDPNLGALTNTHVLNTDLLLNLTALVGAFAILSLTGVLCAMLARRLPRACWPLALIVAALLLLPLSGNLLLLLMKLQVVPLTSSLLSFVSRATNNAPLFNWAGAGLLLALALCWLPTLRRRFQETAAAREPIERRLALARRQGAARLLATTVCCAALVMAGQLWWNLVASQPPRLSEAQPVTLADDGLVHIPVEQVRDGKLHRFVWVADDGKAVRFFVINRYPDKLRFGVVFDACLLCGDQGYVMEGNQVICVACGVHIFIPSIGKPGGCNPVPIDDWRSDDRQLTIRKAALEAGVNYFSTVVTLKVTDPVDGSTLTNTAAEYKYSYGGKTWFFASEANYHRFRDAPQQFVPAEKEEE